MKLFTLSYLLLCIPYLIAAICAQFQLQTVSVEGRRYVRGFGDYPVTLARLRVFMAIYTLACSIVITGIFGYHAYPFMLFFEALVVTVKDCIHYLSGKPGDFDSMRERFMRMITSTERPTQAEKEETHLAVFYGYPDGVRLRTYLAMAVFVPVILILGMSLTCILLYNFFTH